MPVGTVVLSKPKLLLGEGVDEVRFFGALLGHLGIADVQVTDYGGKQRLAAFLQTLVTPLPGFANVVSLGVTRDADDNPAGAFQSVCYALHNAGLAVPPAHGQAAAGPPRVCAWIMPDGLRPGMLEDVCLDSVRADPAFVCLDDYFACAVRTSGRQPNNRAKASVHAWLAAEVEPDKRLGEAAEAGYWPWASAAFQPLIQFLQAL
jgi:hypothetical protein